MKATAFCLLRNINAGGCKFLNRKTLEVLYEDNHIIIVNKAAGEIVQGDRTGDPTLADAVKQYIKEAYAKPGQVFLGITHRLDRPVSGVVCLARTSKALSRLNDMFRRSGEIRKTYWAITANCPAQPEGTLTQWMTRNERQNKSYIVKEGTPDAKKAELHYRLLARSERYCLLEVQLHTGRHHQIRCQLSHMGCPIKGDLKYGAARSNPDGSISLHARSIEFEHPVSHKHISVTAPTPSDRLWQAFEEQVRNR